MTMTARVDENETGRDFVVGDVHGEFDTLEAMLSALEFEPGRDRLFALGDLVDRGPRSADALEWMESGRITLSVRGNHEQMLADRIRTAEGRLNVPWMMHPWFPEEVEREDWGRWKDMIASMPIAATVRTRRGYVGLIHAGPTARHWEETLAKLARGDKDTIEAAMWSQARARGDARRADAEGVPVDGPIHGVRAVMTGHTIMKEVTVTENVWHIDTGTGNPAGHLTIARIDCESIETVTMAVKRRKANATKGPVAATRTKITSRG